MTEKELVYSLNEDLKNKTDNELITYAKQGNEDALECIFERYKDLINIKVSKYFIIGAEKEDIIQEALIGLYKAVKNYEDDKKNSFKSFANLCVERQLITAIKTSNRQKHIPLNSSLSLNSPGFNNEEEDLPLIELYNSKTGEDPLDTITKKEYYRLIGNKIDENLSDFEKKVLSRFAARRKLCENCRKIGCSS